MSLNLNIKYLPLYPKGPLKDAKIAVSFQEVELLRPTNFVNLDLFEGYPPKADS